MSAEQSHLRIQRQVSEGKGSVIYTFAPHILEDLLEHAGVRGPEDLPEQFFRHLCRQASHTQIRRAMTEAEERFPGGTVVELEDDGTRLSVYSSEFGFDAVMRCMPEPDDAIDLLCDPQYSPVEFELRVLDDSSVGESHTLEPERRIGRSLLTMTLEPPNLA